MTEATKVDNLLVRLMKNQSNFDLKTKELKSKLDEFSIEDTNKFRICIKECGILENYLNILYDKVVLLFLFLGLVITNFSKILNEMYSLNGFFGLLGLIVFSLLSISYIEDIIKIANLYRIIKNKINDYTKSFAYIEDSHGSH